MSRLTAGDIAATNLFQIFFFFPLTVCADDGGKPCFTEKRRHLLFSLTLVDCLN